MKKRLISILLIAIMAVCPSWASAYDKPEDFRAVPKDSYKVPYCEDGNPYVTHYAPWLRNFHLMRADEAASLKEKNLVGGESNQMVRMLEISPKNPNRMYFITNTSGIYTTKDGGKHWYNVTNNMKGNDARGLWCDVKNENIVYASLRRDGFYRSIDGGESWELIIKDTDSKSSYRSNTITQDSDGNTYFATSYGIYRLNRSDDSLNLIYDTSALLKGTDENGNAVEKPNGGPLWMDIDVSPDGKHIYAAVNRNKESDAEPGLYVSLDGGAKWEIKATNPTHEYNTYSIAIHPDYSDEIYITAKKTVVDETQSDEDLMGELNNCALYVSEDGGDNFTPTYVYALWQDGKITGYRNFFGLRFGPKNSNNIYPLYFCANETQYPLSVSYNYGRTFENVFNYSSNLGADTIREPNDRTRFAGWYYQAFAADMNNAGRVVFAGNGIYEKTSDGNFNRISGGFSGANVTDITFNSENKPFFVTVDVGSHRADSAYTKNPDGTTNYPTFVEGVKDRFVMAEFNPEAPEHIVACTGLTNSKTNGYYAIRQSFNGGETFNPMEETAKLPEKDTSVIANNTVIRFDGDNIYTSYFSSHDGGTTWERNMFDTEPIFILASSKTNPKKMVGAIGTTTSDTTLCLSEDGGTTWTKIAKLGTPANFDCAEFDVYGENGEDDGDFVWLVKSNRVYYYNIKTGDRNINTYTPGSFNAYSQIAQNPKNPNHILLGSDPENVTTGRDNKLSESYDNGKTWHTVPGLWGKQINEIKFVPNTTEVFIGTMAGVFIYDYAKFNYHFPLTLRIDGKPELRTFPRYNLKDDKLVNENNGEYIIAPQYEGTIPEGKEFKGWIYKGKLYKSEEKIPIGN